MNRAVFKAALTTALLVSAGSAGAAADSLKLFFPWGSNALTAAAKHTLDLAVYRDFFSGGRFLIYGYTDASGSMESNQLLSDARVQALQAYLKDSLRLAVPVETAVGRGERYAGSASDRDWRDRLVTVYRMPASEPEKTPAARKVPLPVRAFNPVFLGGCSDCPPGFRNYTEAVNTQAYAVYKQGRALNPRTDFAAVRARFGFNTVSGAPRWTKTELLRKTAAGAPGARGSFAILLALAYALERKPDSMFQFLNQALDGCEPDTQSAACAEVWDPNILGFYQFEPYTSTEAWRRFAGRILARYRKTHADTRAEKDLPLLLAGGADQSVRFPLAVADPSLGAVRERVARRNLAFIRSYMDRNGFPRRENGSAGAADAAFLLVQHSEDTGLQRKVLVQLQALLKTGAADKEQVALLTDRYLVNATGRQRFGTQWMSDGTLYPIEDIETVNRRRAEFGLEPLRF